MRKLAGAMSCLLSGLLCCAAATAAPPAASAVPAGSSQRVALVIGNGAYKDAPLSNPTNDARTMAEALRGAGFKVTLRENADVREMQARIREFGDQLRHGGVGLFFFAGHGMQIKGRNYLIPVASTIEREDEVAYAAIDAQAVLDKMDAAGNGTNILILDACRNNPFARSFRSAQQGLAQMDAPVGTLVAFATAPGSVASDGLRANGLYTEHLLTELRVPGAKLEDVFKKVRTAVRRDSEGKQVPWEATSLEGDFYFIPPVAAERADVALEKSMWALVKDSDQALDMRAFLSRFPQGQFAALARDKLARLEASSSGNGKPTQTASLRPLPASAPAPAPAHEAPANAYGISLGDRWNYQVIDKYKGEVIENWSRKITKVLPNGDLMSGSKTVLSPEGNYRQLVNSVYASRTFTDMAVLYPKKMAAGHKESFAYREQARRVDGREYEQQYKGTIVVKGLELVKVPAGEFQAYRVERDARVAGVNANSHERWIASQKIVYWYAPKAHVYVALDETWYPEKGAPDLRRTELTSYEVRRDD
ncbi:caspase family protein [Pelomonas sp. KK5]|uniref:caspase family protein n=1 Tax=Pelomonas sp. KK5 TaxID=1855730 RepID=UPI0009FB1600|nr:caspase family protein [Pelomonas sp. KK5]